MASIRALSLEIRKDLAAAGRPHRAGSVDGHSASAMRVLGLTVPDLRQRVRVALKRLRDWPPASVAELASDLVHAGTLEARQVGYEILGRRADVRELLGVRAIEALGRGNDNWKSVDVFACEVTGPCWREGKLTDTAVHRWARNEDRWWRRTALVSTIPLNMRSRGGVGDVPRTLEICSLRAADRDDMVVKALSWSLRELAKHDPTAVRTFLHRHQDVLAARVLREVRNKLTSGRKNPKQSENE